MPYFVILTWSNVASQIKRTTAWLWDNGSTQTLPLLILMHQIKASIRSDVIAELAYIVEETAPHQVDSSAVRFLMPGTDGSRCVLILVR